MSRFFMPSAIWPLIATLMIAGVIFLRTGASVCTPAWATVGSGTLA